MPCEYLTESRKVCRAIVDLKRVWVATLTVLRKSLDLTCKLTPIPALM